VFDRVTIRVSDREASERFYATVLSAIGIEPTHSGEDLAAWGDFSLAAAGDGTPVTRRLHIGFGAPSRDGADAFWRVGTAAGYRDDGAPGPRPRYSPDYYGAFLLDPDGNSAEAVRHESVRSGNVDHLWIRVADVPAAKRFYETVAPHAGFHLTADLPERASFDGEKGSFSVVAGTPTEYVHIAFPAAERATVEAFHRAATGAGYADDGAPGERPEHAAGSYAAFALDPDGNTVEVVHRGGR
jgi:catechol 2,3-dioxygenase-like lactoylglutathione lyase family enzyme